MNRSDQFLTKIIDEHLHMRKMAAINDAEQTFTSDLELISEWITSCGHKYHMLISCQILEITLDFGIS